jgi:hypothetical protein
MSELQLKDGKLVISGKNVSVEETVIPTLEEGQVISEESQEAFAEAIHEAAKEVEIKEATKTDENSFVIRNQMDLINYQIRTARTKKERLALIRKHFGKIAADPNLQVKRAREIAKRRAKNKVAKKQRKVNGKIARKRTYKKK